MPSVSLSDLIARAAMSDAKPKGKKWVRDNDRTKDEKPAFVARDPGKRRATLYDNKGK